MSASTMFRRLFASKARTVRHPRAARKPPLEISALERRDCPAYWSAGNLIIEGTNGTDNVLVTQTPATLYQQAKVKVVQNGVAQTFNFNTLFQSGKVRFNGYGGDDTFACSAYLNVTADGGSGRDVLSGGPMGDTLIGGTGNDAIYGNEGNDQVWGGQGADDLRGGYGTDILYGDDGDDIFYLSGAAGNDTMRGGPGDDLLYGNDGADTIYGDNNDGTAGGVGNDTLYGGAGSDYLYGEGGNDNVVGGPGQDSLLGGAGADTLWGAEFQNNPTFYLDGFNYLSGGSEGDNLYGGNYSDVLDGGAGDDGLFGGLGYNRLVGGPDDDRFLTWSSATDSLEDVAGNDAVMRFNDTTQTTLRYSNEVDPATGQPIEAPLRYAAAAWTAQEISTVDGGLDFAHRLTGNTRFLKPNITLYGNPVFTVQEFSREGAYIPWTDDDLGLYAGLYPGGEVPLQVANARGPNYNGWNGDSGIVINDFGIALGAESVQETVFHELGHNWSNEGSPVWEAWKAASGWTESIPYWEVFDYTVSGDGRWYYANTANGTFYRALKGDGSDSYSTFNPFEDWSTTCEAYRLNRLGRLDAPTASALAAKFAIIDQLVQQLSVG